MIKSFYFFIKMETAREKIEQIREKVKETSIYIARVPKKTKTRFKEIAKEEFEDDYGFLLKNLIDFRDGLLSSPNQILADQIEILTEEITQIKLQLNNVEKPKKKVIRSLGGNVIAEKEGE